MDVDGLEVIHKQVYLLTAAAVTQQFEVPVNARLVAVEWDTRVPTGIAFWYKFKPPLNGDPNDFGETRIWTLTLRGTGQAFTKGMTHIRTLVKDGYAWHLLNAGNFADIQWETR